MLPQTPDDQFSNSDSSIIVHRHEFNQHIESSSCDRPQMAWQMYEQLLRIASNKQQQQFTSKDEKLLWLAAFTGPSLTYRSGVVAGAAEPL